MKSMRILFNDVHNNMPGSTAIVQGGPGRFIDLFVKHFDKTPHQLISVFFSYGEKNTEISLKKLSSKKQHEYFEVTYPKNMLSSSYSQVHTKKSFLALLTPWLEEAEHLFQDAQPTVLFLNGYSLTNYILFAVAKKRNIPVCIQHAGIWKKELFMDSGSTFSPSVRKIFSSLEKDLVDEMTHHIFLNSFSQDAFLNIHNLALEDLYHSSVVPLPVPVPKTVRPFTLIPHSSKNISIAAVARWDAIKNHGALLRLGEYIKATATNATVSVVVNPFNGVASDFRDRYTASINVVAPMNPQELTSFYRTCDIIILPSQFDVSPTVLMEAVIQGVPVIISDQVGWVSDYKALGLSSLIVSPAVSGEMLFNTIAKVFATPERFLKKMNRLQDRILKQHLPEKIFKKYEKIFTSLSNQK